MTQHPSPIHFQKKNRRETGPPLGGATCATKKNLFLRLTKHAVAYTK